MGTNDRVEAIFQDAREMQASAVERLNQGEIQDAAEKAWRATKRATNALLLARTGKEPERTPETGAGLNKLAFQDPAVRDARMDARYYTCEVRLHVECFYHGLCDPLADTERRIRGTADYVEDAARLAGAKTHRSAETPAGIRGKANDPLRMEREQRKLDDTPDILPGLDIIDFVKFLGDPDSYCMHTKQGDITIETIDKINSQAKFRAEVRAATNVIIPKVANRVWVNRRQKILQICKDVGVKDPSHPIPETRSWLHDYILSKRCVLDEKEWKKAPQKESPFLGDGRIQISLTDFGKWLEVNLGKSLNRRALGRRMLGVHAKHDKVNVELGRVNAKDKGKRTSWSVWILPDTFQPPQRDEEGGETGPEDPGKENSVYNSFETM